MNFRIHILSGGLILFNLSTSLGQTGRITGRIVTADSLLDPRSITILLLKDTAVVKGTNPSKTGLFQLENIQEGNYRLSMRRVGYMEGEFTSLSPR
jgi:hypothetical protein